MNLDYQTEVFFAQAYNKIILAEKKFQKLKKDHPQYYGSGTAALVNLKQYDQSNLATLLGTVSNSQLAMNLRINMIRQINTLIEKLQSQDGLQFTPNQNLMFENYFFSKVANLLAQVFYDQGRHSDLRSFQRLRDINVDYSQLTSYLKEINRWLGKNISVNYVDLEKYIDCALKHVASMTLNVAA